MSNNTPKRLYRNPNNRVIAGVCSGIADYFNMEPTWVRIIFLILLLAFGATLIVYLVLWLIVPQKPSDTDENAKPNSNINDQN